MAGYKNDYSMSNNAADAYEAGEKPLSKWTKKAILQVVGADVIARNPQLKALKLKELRVIFLTQTAWHHTSKFYNETNFYACLTLDDIKNDPLNVCIPYIGPRFPEGDNLSQESPEVIEFNKKRAAAIAETQKLQHIVDAIANGEIR